MTIARRKCISIVTPCYNEELNVRDCYEAVRDLFARELPEYDYEHVFCDNDSTDNTVLLLRGLAAEDPRVKVIVNARNFGALRSNYNGVLATTGDARVPVTQSYKLFHALRDNGVATRFIAYPVSGHFPGDPVRARDVLKRWLAWLDQYLR